MNFSRLSDLYNLMETRDAITNHFCRVKKLIAKYRDILNDIKAVSELSRIVDRASKATSPDNTIEEWEKDVQMLEALVMKIDEIQSCD